MHRSIEALLTRRSAVGLALGAPVAAVATSAALASEASAISPPSAAAIQERIAEFCNLTGAMPPVATLDRDDERLIAWCIENGASIDWIILGDPRSMITAFAVRNAKPAHDPLPGMVAAWAVLEAKRKAAGAAHDAAHDTAPHAAETHAAEDAFEAAFAEASDAGREICAAIAETPAGLYAQLRFFLEDMGDDVAEGYGDGFERIIPSLRASLARVEG